MNKEEILEKSRKENNNMYIAELDVISKAGNVAIKVGILICCIVSVLDVIFTEHVNYSAWMIYFSMLGTIFSIKYAKLKRKHEFALTLLFFAGFIIMTVYYMKQLLGVA